MQVIERLRKWWQRTTENPLTEPPRTMLHTVLSPEHYERRRLARHRRLMSRRAH